MKELKYALFICFVSQILYYVGMMGIDFSLNTQNVSTVSSNSNLWSTFLFAFPLVLFFPGGLFIWKLCKKGFIEKCNLNNSMFNYSCLCSWYVLYFIALIVKLFFLNVDFDELFKDFLLILYPGFIMVTSLIGKFYEYLDSEKQ